MSDVRILNSGIGDPMRQNNKHIDHVAHARPGIHPFPDKLYVVAVISNQIRYRSRYELYRAFEKHMEESGAILYTVEAAFGDRLHEITNSSNPRHIQLRTDTELWSKESMINIGISRLPSDWKYVAWIDADISFTRPDWVQETLHQLQHHQVVQLFSHAQDVGPNSEPISERSESYFSSYSSGRQFPYIGINGTPYPYQHSSECIKGSFGYWHCGLAWAARREAIDHLGGLIDWAILGSADHNMAAALLGIVKFTVNRNIHPSFMRKMLNWQQLAEKHIRKNVGFVNGLLIHHWHGPKIKRGYIDRWKVLVNNQFNPDFDIKRDWQGMWQLVDHGDDRSIKLRDDIKRYFRQRNEDSIDTYPIH